MKRFALNFICKNESHVINKMLQSARPITDLIVAVDTGSNDNTIALIQKFGKKNDIPTYIFERPFDNYGNSRNYALEKMKEVVNNLHWDLEDSWGFYFDCDETLEFIKNFSRLEITQDIYYVFLFNEEFRYTKKFLFRLSRNTTWEGPTHEILKLTGSDISSSFLEGIRIKNKPIGASWKSDLENKFLSNSEQLIEYVQQGNRSFRWLFYIGESYSEAAAKCKKNERRHKWLVEAKKYYLETASLATHTRDEKYKIYDRLADTALDLGDDWNEVRENLLNAHSADRRHAEPFFKLINYYVKTNQWQLAYLYSSYTISNYHENTPIDNDISEIQRPLYQWKLLSYHALICAGIGKIQESKSSSLKLKNIVKNKRKHLSNKDLFFIRIFNFQTKLTRTIMNLRLVFKNSPTVNEKSVV